MLKLNKQGDLVRTVPRHIPDVVEEIHLATAAELKAAGLVLASEVVISREDAEMILDYAVTAEAARVDTKDEEAAIDRLRAAIKENEQEEGK